MTMIIGHRGARNLWAENSLTGFRNVLALGVDAVEFDVHMTRAGELLVIHDATLDRTTDGSGEVAALEPGAHRAVRLTGATDDAIPTLDEVLDLFAAVDVEIHVEIKVDTRGEPYAGLEERVIAAIAAHGVSDRSVVTSFSHAVLARLNQLAPELPRVAAVNAEAAQSLGLDETLRALSLLADIVAVEHVLLRAEWDRITAILPPDRLGVWTPNEAADLAFWVGRPVRFVTTDRPDLALKEREILMAGENA